MASEGCLFQQRLPDGIRYPRFCRWCRPLGSGGGVLYGSPVPQEQRHGRHEARHRECCTQRGFGIDSILRMLRLRKCCSRGSSLLTCAQEMEAKDTILSYVGGDSQHCGHTERLVMFLGTCAHEVET